MKSNNYETRLIAVACLIFLDYENKDILFKLASEDKDVGVRQAALYGYAFLKGDKLSGLLRFVENNESNEQVLQLAEKIKSCSKEIDIWKK